MKSLLATAACALALSFAAVPAATSAPLAGASGQGIQSTNGVEQVRHHMRHHHRHMKRHWGHRHWKSRRCWTKCTGVGPLRVCKRKCRY